MLINFKLNAMKRRKTFLSFLLLSVMASGSAQHQLVKLWETEASLKVPESVFFDAGNKMLYVSNIDGEPWGKDGNGSIGKVGLDGKILNGNWVSGLNAPKGMGIHAGKLYVADITELVVIELEKGTIEKKMAIPGSEGLNDVTIDKNGVVYVSDSKQKKVFRVENDQPALYLDNLQGPNGILMRGDDFFVLDNGGLYKVGSDKSLTKITDGMAGGTDGIENVQGDDFIISCWSGTIWYVKADGTKELLLDTTAEKKNTADIGFDPATKTVYVPTFFKNSIVAYKVN